MKVLESEEGDDETKDTEDDGGAEDSVVEEGVPEFLASDEVDGEDGVCAEENFFPCLEEDSSSGEL